MRRSKREKVKMNREMRRDMRRYTRRVADVAAGVRCKWCGSSNFVRYGHYQGVQRYMCKACGRKFTAKDTLPHMQASAMQVGAALSAYYSGMSLNEVKRQPPARVSA